MRITFVSQLSMENEVKVLCVGEEVDFQNAWGKYCCSLGSKWSGGRKLLFMLIEKENFLPIN